MTAVAPPSSIASNHPPAFRDLPFMGVIRVNNEAAKVGYTMGDPSWSNLGQGQPEVGEMEGAPARFGELKIDPADHAYGPVEGIPELRDAVAAHYNRLYRAGKTSVYTRENVAIAPGGRAALTRLGAALAPCKLGYFTPDYTAYEDLLTAFGTIRPVHIELKASEGFRIAPKTLAARVSKDGINALLISNPCNPTGVAICGEELRAWVEMARARGTTLLMDEFYSHFAYAADGSAMAGIGGVSAAPFVEDVNADPVLLIDGLTKCFRYPGWRVGWVVGPREIIQKCTAAGSFLDGGPSRPIQRAAVEVLKPARAGQELAAVRRGFAIKHKMTVEALQALGVRFPAAGKGSVGSGTFYVFGDVSSLPAPMNTGEGFMREAFKHRVLTVPGEFFDVNPGRAREGPSPLGSFVRFSFGPPKENLAAGLARLGEMVGRR
ncbi:MAG TPA: pyridoxal phosphate-dependent aminotransferase [Phycisphaerales bacterium]|mgnify:CR=1 FL=1|nr:pyridoxal phosphate-dependent aminotransferase [Phycisphaerales bacterium]